MRDRLPRRHLLRISGGALASTAFTGIRSAQTDEEGPPDFGGHLDGVSNYDGTVTDRRGQAQVTVKVGVEANGGDFGFGPPAVHVDPGATVNWKWVGSSPHSVVSSDGGPLDSGNPPAQNGVNYKYTFETDGIYLYHCAPHRTLGMRGAIVVGDDYPRRSPTPTRTQVPNPTPTGEQFPTTPDSDWPVRRYGPANRSFTPAATGPKTDVQTQWFLQFPHPVTGAVLRDGIVYAGVFGEFGVSALDAATGAQRWRREFAGEVIAANSDTVYLRTMDGGLIALETATGETRWSHRDLPGSIADLQALAEQVYAVAGNRLVVLNAETGNARTLAETDGQFVGVAFVGGTLYTTEQDHYGTDYKDPELIIRAIDANTGSEQWSFAHDSFPPTRPTVVDGTVYIGTGSHAVHAIDTKDGTQLWQADLGSSVTGLAAVPDTDSVEAATRGTVYAGCADYNLYAFDGETGEQQWQRRTRGVVNPPAVADGVVYASNTTFVLETEPDGSVETETDGSLARDKAVHGFDGATGEQLWTVELDPMPMDGRTPTVGEEPLLTDGILYTGLNTTDQVFKLYAIGGERSRQVDSTERPLSGTTTNDETGSAAPSSDEESSAANGPGFGSVSATLGVLGVAAWRWARRSRND